MLPGLILNGIVLAASASETGQRASEPFPVSKTASTWPVMKIGTYPLGTQTPLTGHPRLWVRPADLPRLRSRAVSSNPVYQQGLKPLAESYRSKMDNGSLIAGDGGCTYCYVTHPLEWGAELFAFMSLIESDPAVRSDYAQRARTLLMHMMNRAVLGPWDNDSDFRGRVFSTNMRSLFYGEGFPLTVDWIYSYLTAEDKAVIRAVFLRWQSENLTAATSGYDHPEPVWVLNDPILLSDPIRFRTAANNFYLAHMNQIGLMALALDPEDDPGDPAVNGDQVRDFLANAIGAWLYVHHRLGQDKAAGAVPPEGPFYGPTGLGRAAEFLLALFTAGYADPGTWGPQVDPADPFWQSVVPAFLHLIPPTPAILPGNEWLGPVYLPADHGDTQDAWFPDPMTLLGPLGLIAEAQGDAGRLEAIRWMQTHLPPGGAGRLLYRAGDWNHVRNCLLYFLLFDPEAPAPADPRPGLATHYLAPGIGRLFSRSGWGLEASFFTFHLGWSAVDHQHQTGNMFEFFRKGEWLTKQWSGYGTTAGASDYKNTLTLQNHPLEGHAVDFWVLENQRGSQYSYAGPQSDPNFLAFSLSNDYAYALGDATNLYNRPQYGADDVMEATRSVFWLKPDTVVVFDRAASGAGGRFKRFWLSLPALPVIEGRRAVMTTPGGQRLVVDALLPLDAALSVDHRPPDDEGWNQTATGEPMQARLRTEAPGGPAQTRFLHILQGLDPGVDPAMPSLIQSTAGSPFSGVALGPCAVLFPVQVGHIPTGSSFQGMSGNGLSYSVPAGVAQHFITGLKPDTGFAVAADLGPLGTTIILREGGPYRSDSGGVLAIDTGAPPPFYKLFLPLVQQ
jgi:hypothetical protein